MQSKELRLRQCIKQIVQLKILIFLTLIITLSSFAADPPKAADPDDIPLLGEETEKAMDDTQKDLSIKVISAAEWLDSFFDDGNYSSEQNKSRASLKLEFQYTKNDDFEIKPRLSVRLRFPNLSKRVNFLIQGADDEDFDVNGDPTQPGDEETDRGKLEAALQYFMLDTESQNISYSVGGSYNYLYGGLRYRFWKDLGKWDLRFTDRIRWYTDDGWENRVSLDLERKISAKWMFRSITSATWAEVEDGISHSEILRLYQVLNEEKAILYETGVYLDTEPNYGVVDVQVKLRYRQRFYRDWLVLEIAPQVTFPEDNDREANPGIIFKLEADFGYDSDEGTFKKAFNF